MYYEALQEFDTARMLDLTCESEKANLESGLFWYRAFTGLIGGPPQVRFRDLAFATQLTNADEAQVRVTGQILMGAPLGSDNLNETVLLRREAGAWCLVGLAGANEEAAPRAGATATPTPKAIATPTPTPRTLDLTYREQCGECGAIFTVDKIEMWPDSFRVWVAIQNTGEAGNLQLILDESRVYTLDLAQASKYREGFAEAVTNGKLEGLIHEVNPRSFAIYPAADAKLPHILEPGERWTGWFETRHSSLPKEAVAIQVLLAPINRGKPDKYSRYSSSWVSAYEDHPFIEIPH